MEVNQDTILRSCRVRRSMNDMSKIVKKGVKRKTRSVGPT